MIKLAFSVMAVLVLFFTHKLDTTGKMRYGLGIMVSGTAMYILLFIEEFGYV